MWEHWADPVAGLERSRSEVSRYKLLSPTQAHVPTVVSPQQLTSREILEREQNQWDPCARFSGGSDTWRVLLMSGLLHRHCRKPRFTQTGSGGHGSSVCIALVALSLILNPKLWQICSRLKHTLSPAAVHCSSLALNFINLYLLTCSFLFLGSRRLFKV